MAPPPLPASGVAGDGGGVTAAGSPAALNCKDGGFLPLERICSTAWLGAGLPAAYRKVIWQLLDGGNTTPAAQPLAENVAGFWPVMVALPNTKGAAPKVTGVRPPLTKVSRRVLGGLPELPLPNSSACGSGNQLNSPPVVGLTLAVSAATRGVVVAELLTCSEPPNCPTALPTKVMLAVHDAPLARLLGHWWLRL
jgi:hypothetical protein